MRLLEALTQLKKINMPVFSTNDAAAMLGKSRISTSQMLLRLAASNHLMSLKKGLWGFKSKLEPLMLPSYLVSPFPCYISLQSALYFHGMISQIPQVLYAVSLGRTRRYHTPLVDVSIHHIDVGFFNGYVIDKQSSVKMATPEKALLDVLYLSDTRTKLFHSLPEVDLPPHFKVKQALKMIDTITSQKKRTLVLERFQKYVSIA
ncbi:MAG: hypothetical protein JKY15_04710 [Deltaproteobacteria bacterium]|nr:hypothetical protein [Deltaproteobacteria bacterium]